MVVEYQMVSPEITSTTKWTDMVVVVYWGFYINIVYICVKITEKKRSWFRMGIRGGAPWEGVKRGKEKRKIT